MGVCTLIRKFCDINSDRYSFYENYSSKFASGRKCVAIVVKDGFSYMEMLMKLTEYMGEVDLSGEELEFSEGILLDELGVDTIVCFPNIEEDHEF